jgi:hypothetical protein
MNSRLALLLVLAGGLVGDELALGFVRVQELGLLTVSLVDVVLVGRGLDAEEVIEGDLWAFRSGDLVAKSKDFLV